MGKFGTNDENQFRFGESTGGGRGPLDEFTEITTTFEGGSGRTIGGGGPGSTLHLPHEGGPGSTLHLPHEEGCCYIEHIVIIEGTTKCANKVRSGDTYGSLVTRYKKMGGVGECWTELNLKKEVKCGGGCPGDSDAKRAKKHGCGSKPCSFEAEESYDHKKKEIKFKYKDTYVECSKSSQCIEGDCKAANLPKDQTFPPGVNKGVDLKIKSACPPSVGSGGLFNSDYIKKKLRECGQDPDDWLKTPIIDFKLFGLPVEITFGDVADVGTDHIKTLAITALENQNPHTHLLNRVTAVLHTVEDLDIPVISPVGGAVKVGLDLVLDAPVAVGTYIVDTLLSIVDLKRGHCPEEQIARLKALLTSMNLLNAYFKSDRGSLMHEYITNLVNAVVGPNAPGGGLKNNDLVGGDRSGDSRCRCLGSPDSYKQKKNAIECCINYDDKGKPMGRQLPNATKGSKLVKKPQPFEHYMKLCGQDHSKDPDIAPGITAGEEAFINQASKDRCLWL